MSGLTEFRDSKTHSSHAKNMFSTRSAVLYSAVLKTLPKIAIRKCYELKSNLYLVYVVFLWGFDLRRFQVCKTKPKKKSMIFLSKKDTLNREVIRDIM